MHLIFIPLRFYREAIDQIRFRKLGKKEIPFEIYMKGVRIQSEALDQKVLVFQIRYFLLKGIRKFGRVV